MIRKTVKYFIFKIEWLRPQEICQRNGYQPPQMFVKVRLQLIGRLLGQSSNPATPIMILMRYRYIGKSTPEAKKDLKISASLHLAFPCLAH